MYYSKNQGLVDRSHGVFRVKDICFEEGASDSKISEVVSEVSGMSSSAPALMTKEALCSYINAPKSVLESMASMPVGSEIDYNGVVIKRCSNLTYNGKII